MGPKKEAGQILTAILMEKRGYHRLLIEPKTNTAYKCHDMKSMIFFFFPSTGHVFYLLIFFQHFNMYVFIFSHGESPQNRYVCVKILKKLVNKKA